MAVEVADVIEDEREARWLRIAAKHRWPEEGPDDADVALATLYEIVQLRETFAALLEGFGEAVNALPFLSLPGFGGGVPE